MKLGLWKTKTPPLASETKLETLAGDAGTTQEPVMADPTPTPTPTPALSPAVSMKTPATIAELRAGFPKHAEFREECVENGRTLAESYQAFAPVQAAELEKANADLAAAKVEADNLRKLGTAGLGTDPIAGGGTRPGGTGAGAKSKFDEKVAEVMAHDKAAGGSMTRGAAMVQACKLYPDLYRDQMPRSSARFDSAGNAI